MNKKQIIAAIKKLQPKVKLQPSDSTILYDSAFISYLSTVGYVEFKNVEISLPDGSYDLELFSKVLVLLGDEKGVVIDGGIKIGKLQTNIAPVISEGIDPIIVDSEGSSIGVAPLLKALSYASNFMLKSSHVSKLIIDGEDLVSFDGNRIFRTKVKGSALKVELKLEAVEAIVQFLKNVDTETIHVCFDDKGLSLGYYDATLIVFTESFGATISVNAINQLFNETVVGEMGSYDLLDNVNNIKSLDLNKNSITLVDKLNKTIGSFEGGVIIQLEQEPPKDYCLSTQFFIEALEVFEDKDCTLDVCEKAVIFKNKDTQVLVMGLQY